MGGYYRRITEILKEEQARRRPYEPPGDGFFFRHGGQIRRALLLGVASLILATAIIYVCDYGVIRYRIATQRSPFDETPIETYYAIHQKNGNIDFEFQGSQPVTCVNALFPHFGMSPCWYARRHPQKRIDI